MSELYDRLGYLLKHAQIALREHTGPALARFQVDGRELAVLTVLGEGGPAGESGALAQREGGPAGGSGALAQHEAARKLGVDRTTMVELVDALERKGLVQRRPDPADRRRKLVALTDRGRTAVTAGGRAAFEAEQAFLAALTPAEADQLRALLRRALGVSAPS